MTRTATPPATRLRAASPSSSATARSTTWAPSDLASNDGARVRILTLGADRPHPLTQATLAVVDVLDWVEHVDHLTAEDDRTSLRKARSAEYREHIASLKPD